MLDMESLCRDSQFQCHPPLGVLFIHPKCLAMKWQNSSAMLDVALFLSTQALPSHQAGSRGPSPENTPPYQMLLFTGHPSNVITPHTQNVVKMHDGTINGGQSCWEAPLTFKSLPSFNPSANKGSLRTVFPKVVLVSVGFDH